MKYKGLAVFSIALMAIIAAPRAVQDFGDFVSHVGTSANSAFLHALIESGTANQKATPANLPRETKSNVCWIQKLLQPAPAIKRVLPVLPSRHVNAQAFAVSLTAQDEHPRHFQLAVYEPDQLAELESNKVSPVVLTRASVLSERAKNNLGLTEEQQKILISLPCVKEFVNSVAATKRIRGFGWSAPGAAPASSPRPVRPSPAVPPAQTSGALLRAIKIACTIPRIDEDDGE